MAEPNAAAIELIAINIDDLRIQELGAVLLHVSWLSRVKGFKVGGSFNSCSARNQNSSARPSGFPCRSQSSYARSLICSWVGSGISQTPLSYVRSHAAEETTVRPRR